MARLSFDQGTLVLEDVPTDVAADASLAWDPRSRCHRAPAAAYRALVTALTGAGLTLHDEARAYQELELVACVRRPPRPYQREALRAWNAQSGCGVVVLPTGAGKSHLATMAILAKQRSVLVVVPTLDLVRQWFDLLRHTFAREVGIVGGGEHSVRELTVTTYDSAYLHMQHFGNRFGLVVFDECHHLPGASYRLAAEQCLAPYRLGLSATPERADGLERELGSLIGPLVYEKPILELSGSYLADYETERIEVDLSPQEREEYEEARATYVAFLRGQGIQMSTPQGFSTFIMRASRSDAGRRALAAYRRQREISFAAHRKLDVLGDLLDEHRGERTLVFTQDNHTAYAVARRFLVPVITHQTRVRERSEILERFSSGAYTVLVTSKVLNEGVDVPDASVAVVLSGSGSVREHVQRLGRILRPKNGKRAVLYEVLSRHTAETRTSERRRAHDAYTR
ncbi:MAG: DEAD/DEAH box helicase family protein [Polyangiaceae bacterium]